VNEINLNLIREAHARIRERIRWTPVMTSSRLDKISGASLFFKCENFQETGSFKARGAVNAVLSLTNEEAARGVATHSSGNHAAALSWAAGLRGIPSIVVMPSTASRIKVEAVERYGGRIVFCEPTHRAREEAADKVVRETGAVLIHPYNDPRIIAGQGTAALEFMGDVPDLDVIICPVGGGGLISGTAIVAKGLRPAIRVLGAEPEGAAEAKVSFESGSRRPVEHPASIAEGLLAFVGDLTFPLIQRYVDALVAVSDRDIAAAVRRFIEVMKIVVEPSGTVAYAAAGVVKADIGMKRVGIILSGGNLDLERTAWLK
jgi:threonine dehydratase